MEASPSPSTFVVAVTGGIAAGKSAVTDHFAAMGIAVYDADVAAREVVARGTEGLAELVRRLGRDILDANSELDRRAMRQRVFEQPALRGELEAVIHPRVHTWLRERVARETGPYCVLAIPLLAESWPRYAWVDRVLVVEADESVRMQRLLARDDIDEVLARRMIAAQASPSARLAIADDVLHNDGSLEQLHTRIDALDRQYRTLAASKARGHV
ncbi:dephospho-CoA kinase [Oleiagrimonas sp. C23AA]|uniref:dephospho-CoA kinase n=1 Tax=Oleiagrimonas sp. C23AA TaxID=2719047 RepID=UPI0014236AE7|nr:dephospho-CoA kinase [Oleiagrimonas sp. C23AA]NII11432.1 dephospho-CoA kinase [Oleiagrimonas sp. C23AA]